MMPYDQSLYLEARNDIIFAESLTIDCGPNLQKQFQVKKHLSFLNSHVVFRAFVGKSETTSVNCKVFIKDSQCEVANDDHALPPQIYIPLNDTEWNPKLSLLEARETRSGFYTWTEDELFQDEECEKIVKEMKSRARLNPKFRDHNLKNLSKNQKVYISMTTSPSRLLKLNYVLRSLDLALIDTIFITLPLEFKRKDRYSIPLNLLKEFPQIHLLSITQDLGPILKSVSAVDYVRSVRGHLSNNDIFIQIDDDNCYAINTIDTLVYYSLLNPNSPVSGVGITFRHHNVSSFGYPYARFRSPVGKHIYVDYMIEGFSGIAYRGIHVDVELFKALTRRDLNPELSSCYLSDDLVISYILNYNNLQLLGLSWEYISDDMYGRVMRDDFPYFKDENALHLLNPDESRSFQRTIDKRYPMCFQIILKYFLDFSKENIPYKSRNEILKSLYSSFKI